MSGNTHKRAQTRTRAHRSHSRAHTTRTITPWPRGPARGPLHGCPSEGVGVALRPSVAETQPGRECEALNGRRLPSADGGVWRAGPACVGSTRAGTARGAMAKAGGAVLAQFRGGSPRDAIGRLENSSHSQVRCEQRRRLGSPRPSMARLEEDGLTENSIASAAPVARMPEAEFPIPGRRAPSTHLSGCRRTCREALRRCAQHGGPGLVRLRSDRVRHRRLRRRRHGGAYGARLLVGAAAAAAAAAALQRCG